MTQLHRRAMPLSATAITSGTDEVKRGGKHYTPPELAAFVACELLSYVPPDFTSGELHVLDPALGDGALLEAIGRPLIAEGRAAFHLRGFDTDAHAVRNASRRLSGAFSANCLSLENKDFLLEALAANDPDMTASLFQDEPSAAYDIIIANPPYVRTQVLGAQLAQQLAREFGLRGRVDLYQVFVLGIARVLREGGHAGLIVSNRFLTTRSGAAMREALTEKFEVLHVWDLGDTRMFEAAVLPALLFLRRVSRREIRSTSKFSTIYSSVEAASAPRRPNLISALRSEGAVQLPDGQKFCVRHGLVDFGASAGDIWRLGSQESDCWLRTVDAHTASRFGDVGKIRVGVKTTADKVFIRSDWDSLPAEEHPELLLPILTHHDSRRFRAKEGPTLKKILYPHEVRDGMRLAVNLDNYPKTRRYLERHRGVLQKREYVLSAGRSWYEIWVPQDPGAWALPKLVFRDISATPTFWLDVSGAVVNGDCYWLADSGDIALLWLALGVANSRFIEVYYDRRFNNKLYAGRRRFITQYVELFPLPSFENPQSQRIIDLSKQLHSTPEGPDCLGLELELNEAVWRAFGLSVEEIAR